LKDKYLDLLNVTELFETAHELSGTDTIWALYSAVFNDSVIITASIAKKYFGIEDSIGKIILADKQQPYTVHISIRLILE
jgi:hypothetical protein